MWRAFPAALRATWLLRAHRLSLAGCAYLALSGGGPYEHAASDHVTTLDHVSIVDGATLLLWAAAHPPHASTAPTLPQPL